MIKRLLTFCGAVVALTLTSTSQAELVNYEFIFVVDSGTYNGVSFSNLTVTATGSILDEIDLIPAQTDRGAFAATSIYDLGAFGIFATDVGGDFFFQFQNTSGASQYGLLNGPSDLGQATRFQDTAGLSPMADPNIPEATGAFRYDDGGPFGDPRTLTNLAGDILTFDSYSYTASGDNVFITAVPAPGALAVFGLAGLIGSRRRR